MPSMELHMDPAEHPLAGVDSSQRQHEHHSSQQQPPAGQQQQPLTPTVQSGLEAIASRKQEIHSKIDELAQVVLNQLEQTKVNFLQWLDGYKKMVDEFGETVVQNNSAVSAETIAAQIRLGRAQQLVSSLGLEVMNPPAEGMEDMVLEPQVNHLGLPRLLASMPKGEGHQMKCWQFQDVEIMCLEALGWRLLPHDKES